MSPSGSDPAISIEELERRMRPGAFSSAGFLGSGESLEEVLAADALELDRLGLSSADLASALEGLLDDALTGRRRRSRRGDVELRAEVFPGFQLCPWADERSGRCSVGGGSRHASVD